MDLASKSVKDFYGDLRGLLDALGLATEIWPVPVELPGAIPFPEDTTHSSYDPTAVTTFWRLLVEAQRVFNVFRARWVGKSSPIHLFWGALDLATTRFSGGPAPPHPGGAPNCGPQVMHEAYSHEVSSAGYWPGGEGEGVFYSYAYPEPDHYRTMPVGPSTARFDEELGEFVLPYTAVRTADDPDTVLLDFLQRTYEAAAITGHRGPRRPGASSRGVLGDAAADAVLSQSGRPWMCCSIPCVGSAPSSSPASVWGGEHAVSVGVVPSGEVEVFHILQVSDDLVVLHHSLLGCGRRRAPGSRQEGASRT